MTDSAFQKIELVRTAVRRFVSERLVPLGEDIERSGGPGVPAPMQLAILEKLTFTSVPLSEARGYFPLAQSRFPAVGF